MYTAASYQKSFKDPSPLKPESPSAPPGVLVKPSLGQKGNSEEHSSKINCCSQWLRSGEEQQPSVRGILPRRISRASELLSLHRKGMTTLGAKPETDSELSAPLCHPDLRGCKGLAKQTPRAGLGQKNSRFQVGGRLVPA